MPFVWFRVTEGWGRRGAEGGQISQIPRYVIYKRSHKKFLLFENIIDDCAYK